MPLRPQAARKKSTPPPRICMRSSNPPNPQGRLRIPVVRVTRPMPLGRCLTPSCGNWGGGGGGGVGFAGRGGAAARDRYLGFMKMIGMPGTGSPVNWVWDGPEEMGEFFGVSWYCTAPPPPPPPHNSPVLSTVGWGYNVACPGLSVIICLQTMN